MTDDTATDTPATDDTAAGSPTAGSPTAGSPTAGAPAAGDPTTETQVPPVDLALRVLAGLAVLVGVVLRFAPRSGLWLDEALTVNISALAPTEMFEALRQDGHPPLFYLLLNVWMDLGGQGDWWVRALPGVLSVLGLPLAYLAGRRLAERTGAGPLGGHRTGLLALAVMAMLPYGIRYGAETRMYSLVSTLVLAGYLLVDDLLAGRSTGRRRTLVTAGTAIVAASLLYSHYWSMWLLAAVGLMALWHWRIATTDAARRGAQLAVGALIAGGVLFLPWVPSLLYQSANTGTPWGQRFGPASVVVISIVDFAGARHGAAALLSYVLVPLVLVACTVRVVARRTMPQRSSDDGGSTATRVWDSLVIDSVLGPRIRHEVAILGLTMGIGWAAAFATNNTFASRYAAVVFPLWVLCIAAGTAVLRQPKVTAGVLAVVLAFSAFGAIGEIRFPRSQTDSIVSDIADDIEERAVTTPVVVTCPDQLGVAVQRQLDQRLDDPPTAIPYPLADDPRFVDWVDYGERNEASDPQAFVDGLGDRLPPDATVYVVTNTGYRTFEGKCEQLVAALSPGRDLTQLQTSTPAEHEEFADLLVLRPRAG